MAVSKDGQLDVPGADQVVRQSARQVETEEARQIGAVVLAGRTHDLWLTNKRATTSPERTDDLLRTLSSRQTIQPNEP